MEYASLAYNAPKLKKLTLVALTQFLKDRIEYLFNIDQVNAVRVAQLAAGNVDQQRDLTIQATLKSCIENDFLRVVCKFELKVSVGEIMDKHLESYVHDFFKGSSTDLCWSLHKYLKEMKYDISIVNPTSRIIDVMAQWTEIRYNFEEIVQQQKGMKA
jgi:hypothetical protein